MCIPFIQITLVNLARTMGSKWFMIKYSRRPNVSIGWHHAGELDVSQGGLQLQAWCAEISPMAILCLYVNRKELKTGVPKAQAMAVKV